MKRGSEWLLTHSLTLLSTTASFYSCHFVSFIVFLHPPHPSTPPSFTPPLPFPPPNCNSLLDSKSGTFCQDLKGHSEMLWLLVRVWLCLGSNHDARTLAGKGQLPSVVRQVTATVMMPPPNINTSHLCCSDQTQLLWLEELNNSASLLLLCDISWCWSDALSIFFGWKWTPGMRLIDCVDSDWWDARCDDWPKVLDINKAESENFSFRKQWFVSISPDPPLVMSPRQQVLDGSCKHRVKCAIIPLVKVVWGPLWGVTLWVKHWIRKQLSRSLLLSLYQSVAFQKNE